MKHFRKAVLICLGILTLAGCRKGEEVRAFSLRTRKARLTGEWRMISGKASITLDGYNESYSFDGTGMTVNVTSYYPVVYIGKYSLNVKIEKDGQFSFKENMAGDILDAKGTWNFNSGVGEDKRKEDIIFTIDKVNSGYTYGYNLFNRYNVSFVYKIKALKNKTLVINSAGKFYVDAKGNYVTLSTEYVLQQ